jgi:surface carbohydrate biosynthesis protein
MSQESRRIVLPIEIKRRELAGKLLLAVELARRGHTVYLGSMDIINSIDRLKPDVYFALSAVNRETRLSMLKRLKKSNVTTIVLDTEGSAFCASNEFKYRTDVDVLEYVDYYCAWGSKAASIAAGESKCDDTSIEITGNPRFDVLQQPYSNVYSKETNKIKERHKSFILVNTNFSVNHVDIKHNVDSSLTSMSDKYKKQVRIIGGFISAIGTLAEKFSNHKIIIRPHPSEDVSLYQRLFNSYENVTVNKRGEVRPWIMASNAVVHNSCTTGVTAALLGTPVYAYKPQNLAISTVPNQVSETTSSISDLVNRVNRAIELKSSYDMTEEQVHALKPHIDNIDHLAVEKISDIVESSKNRNQVKVDKYFSPSFKHIIKRKVVKTIGSKRFGPVYYQKLRAGGSVAYKFSVTTESELAEIVSSFPNRIVPDDLSITNIPGVVYGFKLQS